MKLYVLEIYGYNTYSYSGIDVQDAFYFFNRHNAELKAKDLDLEIVEYVDKPLKQCAVTEVETEDDSD